MVDVQNNPGPAPVGSSMGDAALSGAAPRLWTTGWRRWRPRGWRGWLAACGGFFLTLLLVCWVLSRMTPRWYFPLDPTDLAVIDNSDRAQKLMLQLHNIVQRVPLGEQRWSISQDELNSQLAILCAPPLNADGSRTPPVKPAFISDPVVIFTPGKVTVAARCTRIPSGDPRGGVASAVFSVGLMDGGQGKQMGLVKLDSVWVGYLPVPRSLVQRQLQAYMPEIVKAVQERITMQVSARDVARVQEYVEEVVQDVTQARPFPLQYTVDRKQLVIKQLQVDDGQFSLALVPPTPAAVMPRPMK
jgi:hypothetical protein